MLNKVTSAKMLDKSNDLYYNVNIITMQRIMQRRNTMDQTPMNNEQNTEIQQEYATNYTYSTENPYVSEPGYIIDETSRQDNSKDGLCVASLVLGIVGFFLNPLYICSILAIVFGAIGTSAKGEKAGQAKVGLILGIVTLILQFILDIILTIVTAGMGGVSFCC